MDCFVAEPVIGPAREGRTRWLLAMTVQNKNPAAPAAGFFIFEKRLAYPPCARIAKSSSATMLVILIIGLTAGPAVSL